MKIQCLEVKQPLGVFYIASISASVLKKLTYSRITQIDGVEISGSQRGIEESRVNEIASFLQTNTAAMPNSIILSVNYYDDDNLETDPDKAWSLVHDKEGLFINIPDESLRLAAIVDGQHRISGFKKCDVDMQLPCSIYFDLPSSLQAFIFSTINFNQKKVDKSLAYQLFGYQLDEGKKDFWSPDILAVKISRELNVRSDSPFFRKIQIIKISSVNDERIDNAEISWSISSASFISGVVSLISGNPKKDRYELAKKRVFGLNTRADLSKNDKYPLREYYREGNDLAIMMVIERFFSSMQKHLWEGQSSNSILFRTVGIAAQFDLLKTLLNSKSVILNRDLSFDEFGQRLRGISLEGDYFSPKSATKKRLLQVFKLKLGLITEDECEPEIVNAAKSNQN